MNTKGGGRLAGFTLVELMVSIGIVSVLSLVVVGMLLDTIRSSSRSKATGIVQEEGSLVMSQLRRNLLAADPQSINCPPVGVGDSISFTSRLDSGVTTLACTGTGINAKISSISAQTIDLTGKKVKVASDCNGFVKKCDTSGTYPNVELEYTLSTVVDPVDVINSSSQTFNLKVVVRN